ncbi:MAG: 3-isopropylmalate dehydratase small subunit [Pseudomonadota bacterium]
MRKFDVHTGIAAPLLRDNIDTDAIIPSREMKRVSKSGLGVGLFAGWRYADDGRNKSAPREDFVLNQDDYRNASVLLTGANFGCGSSREHAVWALADFGIRVIIAESYGAIFQRNCYRNGLLAIELPGDVIARVAGVVAEDPVTRTLTVDLTNRQVVGPLGRFFDFDIGDDARKRLLSGADDIDLTLEHRDEIDTFRAQRYRDEPWAELVIDEMLAPARRDRRH